MKEQDKILSLESLRGLAALSVALYHFNIGSHLDGVFIRNAWLMVDFFFVLSGFVIARSALHRITSVDGLVRFQHRRFLRLYPLHLVMLMVFLGIELAKEFAAVDYHIIANNPAFSINNGDSFLANLLLVQNWLFPYLTWNEPSWSISAEFYIYALFGVTALLVAGSRPAMAASAALIVAVAGSVLITSGFGTDTIAGPARCLYGFFLGVLAHLLIERLGAEGRLGGSMQATALLVAAVLAEMSVSGTDDLPRLLVLPPLFAVLVGVLAATRNDAVIVRVLSRRGLVFLGTVSYGIYMIHAAIWWVMNQTLRFVLQMPVQQDEAGHINVAIANPWLADAVTLAGLAGIVALAWLSHRHLERRWRPLRSALPV